jgi:cyclopropane fatty-acyl-phospholipid synthase-like methyltransferase
VDARFDEAAHAGAEHLDPAYVAGYDRKARVDPADDLALLREHGFAADSTLIDFGAATGTFALAAAGECKRVIAVDVSSAMVAALRANVAVAGADNVECVEAGFLSYAHAGPPVDVVYTRNALHHLPDFWKAMALRNVAAMIRPGGVLHLQDLVYSFDPDEAEDAVTAWLESGAARRADGWTRDELKTHLETEHSTFAWILESMIERTGLELVKRSYGRLPFYAEYICAKPSA